MALNAYIAQTQRLLNDEQAQFYSVADLTVYINLGRGTIASQAESLIAYGSLSTVNGQQNYALSTLSPPTASLLSAINLRTVINRTGGTNRIIRKRSWQWLSNYGLNGSAIAATGTPTMWAMQNLGSNGTLWFSPTPNGVLTLNVEATWTPVPLVDDTTPEALSYPWTDAVPYFAAYLAYENAQRATDAQKMLAMVNTFMTAARVGVTPAWTPNALPNQKGVSGAFDPLASNIGKVIQPSPGGEGKLG